MNNLPDIRKEEILLLGLCRLELSEARLLKLGTLFPAITDWKYFGSLANAHGVAALVYHNLEKYKLLKFMPEEVAAFLRNALMMNLRRNEFHSEIIREVVTLLNREKIQLVLLKGMALELDVYGNEGIRQMSDVDILIERDQCIKARNILIANGFVSLPVKSIIHKLILGNLGKHLPSLKKKGTYVEIHHELFGNSKNELTRMLSEKSYEIELKSEKVFIPPPQIFFLYLVRHLWLHERNNESQLRLYTDLVVLVEKYSDKIVNYKLLEYASRAGMAETLAWHLETLRDMWSIPFPSWIDEFISMWYDPRSIERFIFFLKSPKGNPPLDKAWYYRHRISEIPGFHRKILFVAGDILPTISFMKERYKCTSGWRVLLYYPHRLGKILFLLRKKTEI